MAFKNNINDIAYIKTTLVDYNYIEWGKKVIILKDWTWIHPWQAWLTSHSIPVVCYLSCLL